MSAGSLFDTRPPFDRDRLARTLAHLREQGIFIGTSSWKYPGWCGQIYTRERYLSRGTFSQKVFEAECLREYGEVFPAVCGDFSFYQFPAEEYWRRLFANVAPGLQFALKVPEQITAKVFPRHARYGAQAGLVNTSFLDAGLFADAFLGPLETYRERIAALIFEFGTFPHFAYGDVRDFVRDLDRFLAVIPRQYRYSVEIRNPEFLETDYFHCLTAHGAAHVFNSWTRMPELREQLRIPEAFTADFTVCRALLRRGRPYEDAVRAFSPYEEIRDPNPEGRAALRDIVDSARSQGIAAFIFVNNRFEGNAPRTIEAVVDGL